MYVPISEERLQRTEHAVNVIWKLLAHQERFEY